MKITDKRSSARRVDTSPGSGNILIASGQADVQAALAAGRSGPIPTDRTEATRMRQSRMRNQKMGFSGGSVEFSLQRPRDPFFYWEQNNSYYDTDKAEELAELRKLCRMLYRTHPIIGSAIDIFAKWPMQDISFSSKDQQLVEFYETLMFDQLNYEELLVDIGVQYWTLGEAWPMGSFSEDLGVWEDEELLNPDDVSVEKSPFMRDPRFTIRLPETLRNVLRTRQPVEEYQALVRSYPELLHFTGDNAKMPVSNVLLKQLRFKGDPMNSTRGVPLLLRGIRTVVQEEMLNSAQDSISDRLSTPLILAKLGASASDLGTNQPWVPTQDQIADFEGSLDAAFAADFRVLTTHFAVDMSSVFGRETMPNFDADFERLDGKILQVFGLSKTMLAGSDQGQTYAADALNRDLVSQLLSTYQRYVKRFIKDRMLVVAEAQEHFDYENRNGKRYPIMEEVLVVDAESGQKRIVEQPKLLVPDVTLRTMNLSDEQTSRAFYEQLRGAGVPISIKSRMVNIPLDLDEEIDTSREEQIQMAVEAQVTRRETYLRLKSQNLPIPDDLKADFEPKVVQGEGAETDQSDAGPEQPGQAGQGDPTDTSRLPQVGIDDPNHTALAPTDQELEDPPGQGAPPGTEHQPAQVTRLPSNRLMPTQLPGRTRPPESDEQRANMPKPASVKVATVTRDAETGQNVAGEEEFDHGLVAGPRHIGKRRYAGVKADTPLS